MTTQQPYAVIATVKKGQREQLSDYGHLGIAGRQTIQGLLGRETMVTWFDTEEAARLYATARATEGQDVVIVKAIATCRVAVETVPV